MQGRRRNFLRTLAAAGLLQGAGLSGLIREALANGNAPLQAGLRKLTGMVTVNGQSAKAGMLIQPGDTVITGPGSEAIYVIGDNAFLQRADSRVTFGTEAADFFRVVTGRLLSVFGRGHKRLNVPTATIGIRGTGCYIETEAERTYFCLCYGEAEVTPSAAPREAEVVKTWHHDHPLYINSDMRMAKSMVPAEVRNHTDAELSMLEALVGRYPPFYGKTGDSY
jgi:hypothetical protein